MHPQRRDPVPAVRSAMEAGGDEACGRRHCMAQPVAMLRFDEGRSSRRSPAGVTRATSSSTSLTTDHAQ